MLARLECEALCSREDCYAVENPVVQAPRPEEEAKER